MASRPSAIRKLDFDEAIVAADEDTSVAVALAWKYASTSGSEENSSSMAPCANVIVA